MRFVYILLLLIPFSLYSDIFELAISNDLEGVKKYIDEGGEIDAINEYGVTPLMLAAGNENREVVELLLEAGADKNIEDNKGYLAIEYAFMSNNVDIGKLLFNEKWDNSLLGHLLGYAMYQYSTDVFSYMLSVYSGDIDEVFMTPRFSFLMYSVAYNLIEKAKILLEYDVDINLTNENEDTALHIAVNNSRTEFIHLLLDNGADPNTKDKYGTPVFLTVCLGHKIDLVKKMINKGVDINCKDYDGNTPLIYAVYRDSYGVVKTLLDNNADPNIKNDNNETALYAAYVTNNQEMIKVLLDAGAKRDFDPIELNIVKYIKNNDVESVREYIKRGFDVNKTGVNGPLLYESILNDSAEVFSILKDNGAEIAGMDKHNITYLMLASEIDSVKIADLFIDSGADIEVQDSNGKTAFDHAIKNRSQKVIEKMLQNDLVKSNILIKAIENNNIKDFRYLLEFDINVEESDLGLSLVISSIINDRKEFFDILLNYNIDLNNKDAYGNTPILTSILYAKNNRSMHYIETLLSKKVNVNTENKKYESPLVVAVNKGLYYVVELLLANGADIDIRDHLNNTPLILSLEKEDFKMATLLIENGADLELDNNVGDSAESIIYDYDYEELVNIIENIKE